MIAIITSDAWATATIDLDDGLGGGPQTWTPTVAVTDGYTAAVEFRDWIDSTFTDSASFAWSRTSAGYPVITITAPIGYSVTASAAAQSILGAISAAPGTTSMAWTLTAGVVVPSTPTASAYVDQQIGGLRMQGAAASAGVARVGVGGVVSQSPKVRWPVYAADFERIRAVQVDAVTPRHAYIYDGAAWLYASLGTITLGKRGHGLWRASAEVRV